MSPNAKILFFEKESDLGELVIKKDNVFEENVRWYTDKPFIYSVNFEYSIIRLNQLLEYLKANMKEGHQLELWSIWLDDKQQTRPTICNYGEVSLEDLEQMYDCRAEKYKNNSCILINK